MLAELDYLRSRAAKDIIIIDDISFFDQTGGSEPETEFVDDVAWPPFAYDWTGITKDKVFDLMKPNYRCLMNKNSFYTISPREDQMILYPTA